MNDPLTGMSDAYAIDIKAQTEHMTMLRHFLSESSKKSLLLKSSSVFIASILFIFASEENVRWYYFLVPLIPIPFFGV